ncbi:MAG: crotonobetainyl-CoA:carnitine CoA-transferase CaiB-like acyl-CoA transferase [Gammaproteobacteria bacterium]|jgi:crotonobetainyl-CoA:carnitine CoA-transferase CaiB-like acyl-CoA transferase
MQALSNIRVLDLTHIIAGPFCTYQLSVMGADVIKIENSQAFDSLREDGGDLEACKAKLGSSFQTQAANKRAIAIDLKTEQGKTILIELIKTADVLVENYRAGALAALGFGYEEVKALKEDIVYCSLTGFGQHGPLAKRTAYDNVIQAMSGLMATTGKAESGAVKVGPPVLDYGTGIQAAFAIVTALFQRAQTGEGQYIDVSMLDSAAMLTGTNFTSLQASGEAPALVGNDSANLAGYGCFDTQQGQLMVGAYSAEQNHRLWLAMGDEAYGRQLRGMPLYELSLSRDQDKQRLSELFLAKTADQWELILNEHQVPAARVLGVEEAFSHPQFEHRNVFQDLEVDGKTVTFLAAAFSFKENGPSVRTPPAKFGEHTAEVLLSLGFHQRDIDSWAALGAIATA